MTDQTASLASFTGEEAQKKLRKRHRAERRFRMYGIAAIVFAVAFLLFLFGSIFSQGWSAFLQTSIQLPVTFSQEVINPSGNPNDEEELFRANYVKLAREALYSELGVDPKDRKTRRAVNELLSRGVDVQLRDMVLRDPSIIGTTQDVWLLASDNADALLKGSIDRETPSDRRQVSDQQIAWIDQLVANGDMKKRFNTGLFVNGASSNPETAGLGVALIGSFFMMLTVVLLGGALGRVRGALPRRVSRRRARSPTQSK